MAPYVSWIKMALESAFPQVDDVDQGVDLNGNGEIEDTEKVSSYGGDWLAFYKAHAPELKQLGGIFEWGQYFKPDNPIHDFLTIASEDRPEEELELAYEKLDFIRDEVRRRVAGRELSPRELLKTVKDCMQSANILPTVSEHKTNPLINLGIGFSDFPDTSFLVLALAHENGWPVSIVRERYYPDARWEGTNGAMNLVTSACLECGPMNAPRGFLSVPETAIRSGVYMANLDRQGILSTFFTLRGKQRDETGDTQGAREDFSQAIRLDPKNIAAYTELSSLEYRMQRFFDALHDASTATQLDQDDYMAWYLIGLAAEELKNYETAQSAYSRVISNASRLDDPDLDKREISAGYQGLARVRYIRGNYRGVIEACQQVLTLRRWQNKDRGEAFRLIGSAHLALGKNSHDESKRYFEFNLAATAYQQAMGEGEASYETHLGLGSAQVELGLYREAINELTAAIKIRDSNPDIYILRGRAYEALNLDERATQDYRRSASLRLKQQ